MLLKLTMIPIFFVFFFLIISASGFDPKLHKNWNRIPHDKCGLVYKSRIIGGKEAPMNAYPWLVRIGYEVKRTKEISFRCGGVVATSRIVLTAAHCVYFPSKNLKVRVIRLGEHNTETNPDCEGDYCADPVIDLAPIEILVPKTFDYQAFQHDIGLIRLKNEIKFTAFVKPICFRDSLTKNIVGNVTEVAGWGIYDILKAVGSTKLLVVKLSIVDNAECAKAYAGFTKIGPTQICAGGEIGKDSCGGDSGGPLMKVEAGPKGPRYYLLGIVSFGSRRCGKSTTPGVYTNMTSHMEWFLNNLEETTYDSVKVQ